MKSSEDVKSIDKDCIQSLDDGFSINIDKVGMLVLAGIYKNLCVHHENDVYSVTAYYELNGFERALRLVGIDPEMLEHVNASF